MIQTHLLLGPDERRLHRLGNHLDRYLPLGTGSVAIVIATVVEDLRQILRRTTSIRVGILKAIVIIIIVVNTVAAQIGSAAGVASSAVVVVH